MTDVLMAAYEAEMRGKDKRLDKVTIERIGKVAKFLTSPDYKRSLILCGGIGNGKTTMLNAIHRAVKQLKSVEQLGYLWNLTIFTAERINEAASMPVSTHYQGICTCPWLGIDDLGCESSIVKVYGTERMPVVDLIYERYKRNPKNYDNPMIITTNLSMSQIAEQYGERVADRLKEMCEVIVYDNPSFRK